MNYETPRLENCLIPKTGVIKNVTRTSKYMRVVIDNIPVNTV